MSELEQYLQRYPDTQEIDFFIVDLCGIAVGKRYPVEEADALFEKGSRICAATYLLDVRGESSDPLGYGFSDGDPDATMLAVPGTLVPAASNGDTRAQCLARLVYPDSGDSVWFEPRNILQRVIDKFAESDFAPVVAIELEFYLTDKERDADGSPLMPVSPYSGRREEAGQVYGFDVLDEFEHVIKGLRETFVAQQLPASATSSEYGVGQFEVNLRHTSDVLIACDQAAMQRRAVRAVSRDAGFDATFMSKPFPEQPGNGMHVHLSLQDSEGRQLLDPKSDKSDALLESAIAGMQVTMAEAMLVFAPNINALRRFKPDQFVPVTRDWGIDNRSMAFRIVDQNNANRRIEHRVAGAEANPYLVMAAVLAGVHHGITHKLAPTPIASGNAGETVDETLPLTHWDAVAAMRASTILNEYFGSDYIDAYTQVKEGEFAEFMGAALSREYDWYF
ncbi:MAG: glutamine synthetase family protein [Pseudomonadota bacterium]